MRVTNKMSTDNAIYNINASQQKINRLNDMISSNMKVGTPSIDPVSTSKILSIESQSKTVDQYISNIKTGQLWMKMNETVLDGVQKNVIQLKAIALSAIGGLDDPYKRLETLNSLKLYRDQILDMPNAAMIGDQYIFSGFKGNTRPFDQTTITADSTSGSNILSNIDTTNLQPGMPITGPGIPDDTIISAITTPGASGVITLSNAATATATAGDIIFSGNFTGTDDSFQIEMNQGMKMNINVTGGTMLRGGTPPGSTGVDIVKTLDQLILDVTNINKAGVVSAVAQFDTANQQIMSIVGDIGMRTSRLDNALAYQERSNGVLKTMLSDLQEVDMARAAIELTNQKNAFEATLAATAKIAPISLLNYL